MNKIHKIIATGLGTGYTPVAPGTAGSILGIVLLYVFNNWLNHAGYTIETITLINLVAIILVTFAGVYAIKNLHKLWKHDASEIVIDEIIGVWIAVLAMPVKLQYYIYALVLFRFFDIVKPFYIKKFDKKKTNWSVILDDVLAGIYSLIVIHLLSYFKVI